MPPYTSRPTTSDTGTSMVGLGPDQRLPRGLFQRAAPQDFLTQGREDVPPPPVQPTGGDGRGERRDLLQSRRRGVPVLLQAISRLRGQGSLEEEDVQRVGNGGRLLHQRPREWACLWGALPPSRGHFEVAHILGLARGWGGQDS
jgi:hypothetical protein